MKSTITLKNVQALWDSISESKPPTHVMILNEKGQTKTYKVGSRRLREILKKLSPSKLL